MDEIGIVDNVPVGLVDLVPLLGIAVDPLGDLRETVTLLDRVGLSRRCRGGSGGGSAALDTGEVGEWLFGIRHLALQRVGTNKLSSYLVLQVATVTRVTRSAPAGASRAWPAGRIMGEISHSARSTTCAGAPGTAVPT